VRTCTFYFALLLSTFSRNELRRPIAPATIFLVRERERGFGDWDGGNDIHYHDVWKEDAIDPYHTKNNVESVWSVIDRSTCCVIDWDKNDQKSGGENLVVVHCDDKNKEKRERKRESAAAWRILLDYLCCSWGCITNITNCLQ